MSDSFSGGESDAAGAGGPQIETMGASYRIRAKLPGPGRGEHQQLKEPYLMPPYHGRNGSNERTVPAIVQTPLGGMMPGPNAIPPAIVVGQDYRAPVPNEDGGWHSGIIDAYPEGCPVPHS